MLTTDVKPWVILNAKEGKVFEVSHEEFKALLDRGGVKLEGKEVTLTVYHNQVKIWVDASINN